MCVGVGAVQGRVWSIVLSSSRSAARDCWDARTGRGPSPPHTNTRLKAWPGRERGVALCCRARRGVAWRDGARSGSVTCVGWLTMEPVIPGPERPSPQQQLLPAVTPGHGGHHAHLPRPAGHRPGPRHRRGHQQTVHHLQREHPGCVLLPSGWSRPFYSYEHPRTCSTAVIFKIQVY